MSTMEMAGTFRRAAEVIRTGGLIQGIYEEGAKHCTVGALMTAKGVEGWSVSEVQLEVSYLVDLLGGLDERDMGWFTDNFRTVTRWNDNVDRTADDVITLLEQAAEKLEADL